MHPLKRTFLIFVFGLGTVGGFAHGFASLGHCASACREGRRASFEDHVAEVCTRAAERVHQDHMGPAGYAVPMGHPGFGPAGLDHPPCAGHRP